MLAHMKRTTLIAALILIALGIAFALVRMDILDAEALRFLPALLGVLVAGALIFIGLQRRRTTNAKKPRAEGKR